MWGSGLTHCLANIHHPPQADRRKTGRESQTRAQSAASGGWYISVYVTTFQQVLPCATGILHNLTNNHATDRSCYAGIATNPKQLAPYGIRARNPMRVRPTRKGFCTIVAVTRAMGFEEIAFYLCSSETPLFRDFSVGSPTGIILPVISPCFPLEVYRFVTFFLSRQRLWFLYAESLRRFCWVSI